MPDDRDVRLRNLGKDEWFQTGEMDFLFPGRVAIALRAERRDDERCRSHGEVRLDPGGRRAVLLDLSGGGVTVAGEHAYPQGAAVDVEIHVEAGAARARGVVRWTHRNLTPELGLWRVQMGIQFLWVELGMKELLHPPVCLVP